jgi:hypothetical protein
MMNLIKHNHLLLHVLLHAPVPPVPPVHLLGLVFHQYQLVVAVISLIVLAVMEYQCQEMVDLYLELIFVQDLEVATTTMMTTMTTMTMMMKMIDTMKRLIWYMVAKSKQWTSNYIFFISLFIN